jgi:hypothetical protein
VAMIALLCFFLTLFASPFKSKSRLEAENAVVRHQLIVLQRRSKLDQERWWVSCRRVGQRK